MESVYQMRTMFSFKYFLVIIFFCHFVTCSKFLSLTNNGWKSTRKITGEQKTYLLISTESSNEFEGNKPNIKLSLQEQSWVLEHGQKKYSYPASEGGSLPFGEKEWSWSTSTSTFPSTSTIEIKELRCGKNQGYMIDEGTYFPRNTHLNIVASRTALSTTAENCFR